MTFRALDAMRAIRDLSGLSAPQKAVLYAITLRSNDRGESWPSYDTIAQDAGLSLRAAKVNVASVQKLGHITVTRRHVEGKREAESNLYVVHVLHYVVHHVHDVVQQNHEGCAADARQVMHDVHSGGAPGALDLPNELPSGTAQGSESAPLTLAPPPPKASRGSKGTRGKSYVPASEASAEEVDAWLKETRIATAMVAERDRPEVEKMLDYFRANGKAMADWYSVWRNWLRRAPEFSPRGHDPGAPIFRNGRMLQPPPSDLSHLQLGMTPEEEQKILEATAKLQAPRTAEVRKDPEAIPDEPRELDAWLNMHGIPSATRNLSVKQYVRHLRSSGETATKDGWREWSSRAQPKRAVGGDP